MKIVKSNYQINILPIAASQRVTAEAAGLIFDVDDTQLVDSGEKVHNGLNGRFARALYTLLKLNNEQLTYFTDEEWAQFKKATGKAEVVVCADMARLAEEKYNIPVEPHELQHLAAEIFATHHSDFLGDVKLAPGLISLLKSARNDGLNMAVCSASSNSFVEIALSHFGVIKYFDALICGASKKVIDNVYSERSTLRACESIALDPRQAIMFGDCLADSVSAFLAGIPISVIVSEDPCIVEDLVRGLNSWQAPEPAVTSKYERRTILIVDKLSQVAIRKIQSNALSSRCNLPLQDLDLRSGELRQVCNQEQY